MGTLPSGSSWRVPWYSSSGAGSPSSISGCAAKTCEHVVEAAQPRAIYGEDLAYVHDVGYGGFVTSAIPGCSPPCTDIATIEAARRGSLHPR